jgi:hypothetical protein
MASELSKGPPWAGGWARGSAAARLARASCAWRGWTAKRTAACTAAAMRSAWLDAATELAANPWFSLVAIRRRSNSHLVKWTWKAS